MIPKKIIFFVDPNWALGSVHYELTKYLYQYNIDATGLQWNADYSFAEIQELSTQIDYFVSLPTGIAMLIDKYNIAPEQCIAVVHALLDIHHLARFAPENIQRLHKYSAISDWLVNQSQLLNLTRVPVLTPIGINYTKFYAKVSDRLTTIGFGGTYHSRQFSNENMHTRIDPGFKKRGYLVKELAEKTNLNFTCAQEYHHNYATMPGYYPTVDCIISASIEEGAGLPVLEAAAAGKLVITTPVGYHAPDTQNFPSKAHVVPINEAEFLSATTALLNFYKYNPEAYRKKCHDIQEQARGCDWSNVIDKWIEILK